MRFMRLFNRLRPNNDVLFLMPVRCTGEKLPKSKVRMLCCDAVGKLYTSLLDKSVYNRARDSAGKMSQSCKYFATIGMEVSPGEFAPAPVEIGAEEVWALEHVLEHALRDGKLPDILKKYPKRIIKLGEPQREVFLEEYTKRQHRARAQTSPGVLNRLQYYSEQDIEFSMPIYKAEHSYPLVVLKVLPPTGQTADAARSLLILDSDGDLAVIKVPFALTEKAEKGLKEWHKKKGSIACVIISHHSEGLAIDYMVINQLQRKALDTITRYFEANGYGKRPISATARTVLARARDKASSLAR